MNYDFQLYVEYSITLQKTHRRSVSNPQTSVDCAEASASQNRADLVNLLEWFPFFNYKHKYKDIVNLRKRSRGQMYQYTSHLLININPFIK